MAVMIREQPNSQIFFKSFLELDMCNLATLLSFDNRLVAALLSEDKIDKVKHHDYPIFYKIRNRDGGINEFKTAIDIALENSQI